jgi:hypothetical protein
MLEHIYTNKNITMEVQYGNYNSTRVILMVEGKEIYRNHDYGNLPEIEQFKQLFKLELTGYWDEFSGYKPVVKEVK